MPAHTKPIEQHLKDGTWRADRHSAPRVVGGRVEHPVAPRVLDAQGKALWKKFCAVLIKGHVYDEADYAAVLGLVRIHRQADILEEELRKLPATDYVLVNAQSGVRYAHPLLAQHRQAHSELRKALAELGLSPVARTRLPARTAEQAEEALDTELGATPRQRLRAVGENDG